MYKWITLPDEFLFIQNGTTGFRGGNQGWWKDKNDVLCRYGCGVIAVCDLESYLYRRNTSKSMEYKTYYAYVEGRFAGHYSIWNLPIIRTIGLLPIKMEKGIRTYMKEHLGMRCDVRWARRWNAKHVLRDIIKMLCQDIPVVASYDCSLRGTPLDYYMYDEEKQELVKDAAMRSHYFTIIGVWTTEQNVYNRNDSVQIPAVHTIYLEIATYGLKRFISFESWAKQLGCFTNILTIEVK